MKMEYIPIQGTPPTPRCWVVSVVIKSFKGRRDVDVHLFRTDWNPSEIEGVDWQKIIEAAKGDQDTHPTKRFVMEAFTREERDALIEYFKNHYSDKCSVITASPLSFPVPLSIKPLSDVPVSGEIGIIQFHKIPHYSLPFIVQGLFDLSQHKPIVEMREGS